MPAHLFHVHSGAYGGGAATTDAEEYVAKFRPDLMEPVAAWVRGVKFAELAKMTTVFEVGNGGAAKWQ